MSDLGIGFERPGAAEALRRQNGSLRQAIAVVDRLTAVALEGADVGAITAEVAAAIEREVAVYDPLLRALAMVRPEGSDLRPPTGEPEWSIADPRFAGVLETARERRLPLRIRSVPAWGLRDDVIVAPIAVGDQLLGYVVVRTGGSDRDDEDLELLTVQHAASIYALALVESQRDAAVRGRYRADLVESLLLGRFDASNAGELARLAGLQSDLAQVVYAIAPSRPSAQGSVALVDPLEEGAMLEALAGDLDAFEEGVVALARGDHVVVIAPQRLAGGDDSAVLVADLVRRRFPAVGFAFGASAPVEDPAAFGRAEGQARRALAVARRLGAVGEVTTHERLGVHRLLLHVPEEELRSFADDVLGALAVRDVTQRASLVETLAAYLRANGNLRRASEELFVHVNTVSYRIKKIEEVTGLDLTEASDRLLAQTAIEALRALPGGIGGSGGADGDPLPVGSRRVGQ